MLKPWAPVALLVSVCGHVAAQSIEMPEARGHSMTVNQMNCFEGVCPPDIKTICEFMRDSATGEAQLKKMGKRLKWDCLWTWHVCQLEKHMSTA